MSFFNKLSDQIKDLWDAKSIRVPLYVSQRDKRAYKKGFLITTHLVDFLIKNTTEKIPSYLQGKSTLELNMAIDICNKRLNNVYAFTDDPYEKLMILIRKLLVEEVKQRESLPKTVALAENYIGKDHPMDATAQMMGIKRTKPMYKVVSNRVGRSSYPHIDMKIVSVASCLPGEDIAIGDNQKIASKALEAIEHYASLPIVQAFFLAPYRFRCGAAMKGAVIPPDEQCRMYAGVENLLLEIYDELPQNGTITDTVVERKINQLMKYA